MLTTDQRENMWTQIRGSVRGRVIIGTLVLAVVIGAVALLVRPQAQAQPRTTTGSAQATINCASPAIQAAMPNVVPNVTAANVVVPAGEPAIVATVNGVPITARIFEAEAATMWQTNQRTRKTLPVDAPAAEQAVANASLSQVRQEALNYLITNHLWLQAGQQAGLQVSATQARAFMVSYENQTESLPADSQGRTTFEAYLCSRHESIQAYENDPQLIAGYQITLTEAAARKAFLATLTPAQLANQSAALQAHEQALWHAATIKIYITFS
jgi:hypothetical protein